jgi:hypothetical protein
LGALTRRVLLAARLRAARQAAFTLEFNLLVVPLLAQLLSWSMRCARAPVLTPVTPTPARFFL